MQLDRRGIFLRGIGFLVIYLRFGEHSVQFRLAVNRTESLEQAERTFGQFVGREVDARPVNLLTRLYEFLLDTIQVRLLPCQDTRVGSGVQSPEVLYFLHVLGSGFLGLLEFGCFVEQFRVIDISRYRVIEVYKVRLTLFFGDLYAPLFPEGLGRALEEAERITGFPERCNTG